MTSSSDNQPAFTGHIANTLDALLIFEACRRGNLPRTQSRLSERERRNIKSGDVYVFGEQESKIKRWTDGRKWSPSRIMNNFLVYSRNLIRELEPSEKETRRSTSFIPANTDTDVHNDEVQQSQASGSALVKRERSQIKFGADMFDDPPSSASGAAKEKVSQIPLPGIVLQGGLVKKTISVGGLHMISYYVPADLKDGTLKTPSSVEDLASLEINHIFLLAKYFRHPPQVSFGEDGMPRFVAITDEDPMPRKGSTSSSTTIAPKKVKQEPNTSSGSRQEETRPSSGLGDAGPSFFPKSEPQDDIFPEEFGTADASLSHLPSPPTTANRRSSTGYSSGSKYRSVPGLARSLSSASDTTTTAGEQDHPPSMRPRTGSSSGGGHRHEPYRVPLSRGNSITSPSTYHAHSRGNLKSPRHSFSMEYSPNMTHLRQRNDVMYTEGIGRHLRSASLSSGLGVPSRRGSMTSSPSIHAQVSAANASTAGAGSPEHIQDHQSPYFGSQHSHMSYSPYVAQRPYTSPDGGIPEQALQEGYVSNTMHTFPPTGQEQYQSQDEHARRMSMAYSPTMQAQPAWPVYEGGEMPFAQPPATQQQYEQHDHPNLHFVPHHGQVTSFGLPATLPAHHQLQQQAESVFISGHQPYPMGEFLHHRSSIPGHINDGSHDSAGNVVFQYYPPSALPSSSSQRSIPLLRTEFSPLMPASASYPSSHSSQHPQLYQEGGQDSGGSFDYQAEQHHPGLGLQPHHAPPSYSHQHHPQTQQESYPANLGKAKIDYKVVEPVSWPTYTSPKVAQQQYQHQPEAGVHPPALHPEHPYIG